MYPPLPFPRGAPGTIDSDEEQRIEQLKKFVVLSKDIENSFTLIKEEVALVLLPFSILEERTKVICSCIFQSDSYSDTI